MFILYSYLLHKNPLYISLYLSKWILCNSQMDGSLQLFDLWVGSTSPYSSSMTQSFKCFALSFSQLYCYILWFHNVCIEHFTYLNHKTYQIVSVGQYCHCLSFCQSSILHCPVSFQSSLSPPGKGCDDECWDGSMESLSSMPILISS